MKTIDKLLTAEQRAVIECAEGILSREMEARLITSRETNAGLGFDTRPKRPGAVHKPDEFG